MPIIRTHDNRYTWQCREGETLASGADRHQLGWLFTGCRGGGCGVCQVRVISGDYTLKRHSASAIPPDQQARGVRLACCLMPRTDMVVEILKLSREGGVGSNSGT